MLDSYTPAGQVKQCFSMPDSLNLQSQCNALAAVYATQTAMHTSRCFKRPQPVGSLGQVRTEQGMLVPCDSGSSSCFILMGVYPQEHCKCCLNDCSAGPTTPQPRRQQVILAFGQSHRCIVCG